MYIFECTITRFSCKFYKQEINVQGAALENAGEVLEKQAWIFSGGGVIFQATWRGHSHFATKCYYASEVLKYCKYRVIGGPLFICNFQALPLAILKGLEGHQIVAWDHT